MSRLYTSMIRDLTQTMTDMSDLSFKSLTHIFEHASTSVIMRHIIQLDCIAHGPDPVTCMQHTDYDVVSAFDNANSSADDLLLWLHPHSLSCIETQL